MGDDKIQTSEQFLLVVMKYQGKSVAITIYRDGKMIEKQVQINREKLA
jgi:hypothetical protein